MRQRHLWIILVPVMLVVARPHLWAAGQKPPVALGRALLSIHAARMHTPGTLDQPLLDVAGWDANAFDSVRRNVKAALARMHEDPASRNDILRRGMLPHTDIAILTPDRAARFTRLPDPPRSELTRGRAPQTNNSVTVGMDGQYLGSIDVTAHWMFARALAQGIHPDPANDPFVARWYRATTAYFEIGYRLGIAFLHLDEALKVFPRDPGCSSTRPRCTRRSPRRDIRTSHGHSRALLDAPDRLTSQVSSSSAPRAITTKRLRQTRRLPKRACERGSRSSRVQAGDPALMPRCRPHPGHEQRPLQPDVVQEQG